MNFGQNRPSALTGGKVEEKDESHGGKCRLPALIAAGQIGLRKPPAASFTGITLVNGVFAFTDTQKTRA
ncbi:Hypothetical protein CpE19_0936 [Corynebacterium pseudotuberculosis]|nr:Hypothetical protein CpE19_0936 [Corynebacterium pseudotuberculosis]